MSKVNIEQATAEVDQWLDYKRISESKRESSKAFVNALIEAVCDGHLVLMENHKWKHILVFPLEADGVVTVTEFNYKPRITDNDLEPYKKLIKSNDLDSNVTKTILALTNKSLGEVLGLDKSTDRSIAEAIAVFFL